MQTYTCFRVERAGAVATVYLANAAKRNAMGPAFWSELPQLFGELDADESVRAIVLAADGPVWTAGLDLVAMMPELQAKETGRIPQQKHLHKLIRRLQDSITSVERARQPVIAAIHGKCIGGGIDLITACDIRLASSDAVFSVREVRIAIVADVGTLQRLPRIVGEGRARELAYTGEDFSAEHAHRIGLLNSVHKDRDAVIAAAQELAGRIARNSPLAVQGTKAILNDSRDRTVADGLSHVALYNTGFLMSDDLAEAVTAFMEKRDPNFKGT